MSDSSSLEVRQMITYLIIRLFFFSLYFWSWYENIYFHIFDIFDILSFSSLWYHIEEAALLLSVWLTEIISIYMYIPRVFMAFKFFNIQDSQHLNITFMPFAKCTTLLTRFLDERNHFPGALQQHLLFEESFWRNHILFIDHPSPLHTSPIFGPY